VGFLENTIRPGATIRAASPSLTSHAGLKMGVTQFDSTVGGLGGCPFAGAVGPAHRAGFHPRCEGRCRRARGSFRKPERVFDFFSLTRACARETKKISGPALATRQYGHTAYHVIGTCKMGHDPRAVVNDELRVHGLASLRVVDASIMPTMTSANPVIMIAEKAADMVKATASRPAPLCVRSRQAIDHAEARKAARPAPACTSGASDPNSRSCRCGRGLQPGD
jgi:hypothetical protein